eukprot:2462670-Rhodomonas_salina.1
MSRCSDPSDAEQQSSAAKIMSPITRFPRAGNRASLLGLELRRVRTRGWSTLLASTDCLRR